MPLIGIIALIAIILIPTLLFVFFFLPNYKSVIERAKKIDPSVKTYQDAQFVLSKELAKSVGDKK